jgi:hypothetical protein
MMIQIQFVEWIVYKPSFGMCSHTLEYFHLYCRRSRPLPSVKSGIKVWYNEREILLVVPSLASMGFMFKCWNVDLNYPRLVPRPAHPPHSLPLPQPQTRNTCHRINRWIRQQALPRKYHGALNGESKLQMWLSTQPRRNKSAFVSKLAD